LNVGGSVTVLGRTNDLVVIFGPARLAGTAVVEGDAVVIGGNVTIESGAVVAGDLVVIGGALDAPADFAPRGEQIVLGSTSVGDWLRPVFPWVTRGLLWGRLIVPDVPWVWAVAGLVLLVYLAIDIVFPGPVAATTRVLAEKALTAFVAGLLVLLATGPVTVLLAVTIAGIAVIPFLWCALFLAGLLGKVAAVRWLGSNLVSEGETASRGASARSILIGFVVLCLAYMVPLLGVITWVSLGVFGMGAAALAFLAGMRRENPRPPALPLPVAVSVPSAGEVGVTTHGEVPPAALPTAGDAASRDMTLLPRATFLSRLGAFVLDVLLVALAFGLLDVSLDGGPGRLFMALLVYHIAFWTWQGLVGDHLPAPRDPYRRPAAPLRGRARKVVSLFLRGPWTRLSLDSPGPGAPVVHDRIAGT
jgi:hypothetical protein